MTLEELEDTLPNGLHDAEVRKIEVDYELRELTIDLSVWVGDMQDPPELREAYKKGCVKVSGLLFMIMEAPNSNYPYKNSPDLRVDGCDTRELNATRKLIDQNLLESLPPDAFLRSFFVNEWNAFIHIAARAAEIFWANDGAITYR